MGNYFLKILFAILMLLLHDEISILGFKWQTESAEVKCNEKEKQSLLNFKQGLRDPFGMLSTWSDDENNTDCCKWRGIECHNETGHVKMLHLRGDPHTQEHLIGEINITSLIELQNLEYLDLSRNSFRGSQIPKHLGSFSILRYLNLSYSSFGGRIPYELGNLSKLEYLSLGINSLAGAIPSQLGKVTHLRYLDLSFNFKIDGEIPCQLGNLSQLQYLDLGKNSLSGAIPFHRGNLPMLNTLKLDGNDGLTINDAEVEWLSALSFLTNLDLNSFPHLGSSHHRLQTISKIIPNLRELRLVDCGLSDNDIPSLFHSHSNFSTSLTILDLSSNMLTSSTFQLLSNFSLDLQELYLSHNNIVLSSLLYPSFPFLMILDLSYNNLTSLIFHVNFNFTSKLQELYLRNCSLMDKSFPMSSTSTINSSSSLIFLDFSFNLLKSSSAIFHWLFNFTTNLHSLALSENLLEGPIPNEFGRVMDSLVVLDLSSNNLQGEIPSFFGNICTLQTLYLSNNNLSGKMSSFIQNSSWCNRHIFQSLDLSYNWIIGMLPESIMLLSELKFLSLEGNSLEGDIIESHLNNFSKLKFLSLSHNSLALKFRSSWVPPFQLVSMDLASCKLGPSFPGWLRTQSSLNLLDISHAGINDYVPEWLWNNLQYMTELIMSHNKLVGAIPNSSFKLRYQPFIILNSNQFEGAIPSFLLQASMLMLSENKLSDFFSFLCGKNEGANLDALILSNNQLKGQLPDCWKSLNSLEFLDLSNNNLSGNIPQSMGTLVNLGALVLRNNSLTGELPSILKNCTKLVILDVGENLLSGRIPSWIGENLPQLKILSLRVNHFFGSLPSYLCYLRQIHLLDLSRNNLSKGIPTCLKNFTTMMERRRITTSGEIVRNRKRSSEDFYDDDIYDFNVLLMWKGVERVYLNQKFFLKSIDLSSNNLTGEIPKEIGYLLGLVSLNLSRNNLSGEIPSKIGDLYFLEFLDLSRNHFSGKIPSTLSKIDRLSVLDLSYNSLTGRIPLGRQLQTFDASQFEGNLNLCGEPLNKSCLGDETTLKPQGRGVHDEDENSFFYEAFYMSLGLGYFTGFWGLIGPILLWRPWRNAYLRFLNRLTDYIHVMVVLNVAKCHRWLKG